MPPQGVLYRAEIASGSLFKGLVDLLANCLTGNAHFRLDEEGIFTSLTDDNMTILIRAGFERKKFSHYICDRCRYIGVNLKKLCALLRHVKKKDKVILSIHVDKPRKLCISYSPNNPHPETAKSSTSDINYHDVRKTDITVDGEYEYPQVLKSVDFQKMCKQMQSTGKKLTITMQGSAYASFRAGGEEEIASTEMEFGIFEDEEKNSCYVAVFDTARIHQLIKLYPLSSQIQIYAPKDSSYPLKLRVDNNMGWVEAYIKDRDQLETIRKSHRAVATKNR